MQAVVTRQFLHKVDMEGSMLNTFVASIIPFISALKVHALEPNPSELRIFYLSKTKLPNKSKLSTKQNSQPKTRW